MSTHTMQHSEYQSNDGRTGYAENGADDRRSGAVHRTEEPPYAWRAPFSSYFYREVGYTLTGLPLAIVGFTVAVTLFCLGLGTFVTVLGLPVLAGLTVAARGLGRLERARVRGLLALDVPGPEPVRPRPGFWGAVTARLTDAAGWKAVLYQVVMFPWAILSMTLSLVFLSVGWTLALYPAYHWVFARWTDWPGYRLYDFTTESGHYVYYIESPLQIAGVSLVGLLFLFVTPQLVRGLTNVNRLAVRGLLGR
ncbi:sensor domain-containing protein [Kitasatospora sp. NPDC094019]|uniref:sensor domain-containing protein n=1 Tax=Kitasatospora sp. NPDC094019 TaxID=3364091 RepID=UPI003802F057